MKRRDMFTRATTAPGIVALLDLVLDARERDRELVVGEADVGEVRVDAREVLGGEVDVELALLRGLPRPPRLYDTAMGETAVERAAPSSGSPSALGARPVELERPKEPDARRLRDERRAPAAPPERRPPRELAEELAARGGRARRRSSGRRSPGRGSSTSGSRATGTRESSTRSSRAARTYGGGRAGAAAPDPGRDGVGEPDGADHRRVRPQRRLRRLRRAPARVRGPRGRARVLLQRRGRPDGALPRVGRGRRGAGRSRPRTATTASTSPSWRAARRRSGRRACSSGSRRRSSASASTSTRGRGRASSSSGCRSSCRGSTPTSATARSGRAARRTATTTTAC